MSTGQFPSQNIETIFHAIIENHQLKPRKDGTYRGYCPAHRGKSGESFQLSLDHRGIGLKCWGGCSFDALLEAMGYTARDMFVHDHRPEPQPQPQPKPPAVMRDGDVTWYRYYDASSNEVYRVRREDFPDDTKKIRPYQEINQRWVEGLDSRIRRVPFNLNAFISVRKTGATLYICEGEKCTERAAKEGLDATCFAGGASGWTEKFRDDYLPYFRDIKKVCIVPDNDASGQRFAEAVAADLKGVVGAVCILPLPGLQKPKEDIVEWLDKYGHTVEELVELAHAAFDRASGRKRVVSETALDLWHATLEPREDLIEELVTEGTHLIASKKGAGKTHLLFNLGVSVATGAYALSKFPTVQSGVLCYFLDDPRRRIKLRLHEMSGDTIGADTDPDPSLANLTIKYEVPGPRSAKAFLDHVQAHLDAHPDTKLIIVDMLGRIKPPARGNANLYQDDNDFMTEIRQFMAERRLTCLISHHVRKASADDIYETINGTTGLTGAVDGVFILESQRGSNTAILHAMGNDIEEREIGLKFDPARMSWDVADVSDVKTPARGPLDSGQSRAREWLKEILSTGAMTPDEVVKRGREKGFSRSTVYRAIKKMDIRIDNQKEEGRLVTYWTLPANDVLPTYQKPEIPGIGEIPEKPGIPETASCFASNECLSQVSHDTETAVSDDKSSAVSVSQVSQVSSTHDAALELSLDHTLDVLALGCMHQAVTWDDDAGVFVCADCGECVDDEISFALHEPAYVSQAEQACCWVCGVTGGGCSHAQKRSKR